MTSTSKIVKRLVVALAASTVALTVIAVVLIATFDWNRARGWISEQVNAKTGRELVIGGNLKVHPFSFTPRVRAEQVTLSNADWGEKKPMLVAETVEFSFSLLDLLRGRVIFPDVALDKAAALLQRDTHGRRNWILRPSKQFTGESPLIHKLSVNDSHLLFKDKLTDTDVDLKVRPVSNGPYGIGVQAQGRVKGIPVTLKGAGGGLLTLIDEDAPYPLKLDGSAGGAQLSFEGKITGLATLNQIDGRLSLAGRDLALLADALKFALPHTAAYKLAGNLERRGTEWHFSGFRGTVGSSDLGGDFRVNTGAVRPVLNAKLASRNLDIADLGGFVGAQPGAAHETKKPGKVLPSEPFDLAKLRRIDAHVVLEAARFRNRDTLPLDHLKATLNLVDGVFKLEPIVFGVAGGSMNSQVTVDARAAALVVDVNSTFSALRINQMLPKADILNESFGAIDGRLRLKGTGNSTATMLSTSSGRIDLYSRGGKISNLLMEYAGADVAEIIAFWVGGDKQIQLRCGIAAFNVNKGVMTSEVFVVDTDDTYIGGKGSISLQNETLDMTLTPLPKDMSIVALRGPLRVTGTFANPRFGLDKGHLAGKIGASVLLALINPLAAIIPLIETGPGKDAPCAQLLNSVQVAANSRKPSPVVR
jgi:uncharacterized protein involved in outer membrane biogenesis